MARVAGWLLVALLLGLVGALRWQVDRRAQRLLAGEARGLAVVEALARASGAACDASSPHPGLAKVLEAAPGVELLPERGDGEKAFAHDDDYVYGLALTVDRKGDSPIHGWVLRAWPLQFGVTGDVEYHVSQDGVVWQGHNDRGRSGTETGFPPPFPEPGLAEPGPIWRAHPAAHR